MFISSKVADWVTSLQKAADVNAEATKSAIQDLREELVAIRTERDILRQELTAAKLSADWLRLRFNQLEMENKQLLQKAYNITLPAPALQRVSPQVADPFEKASALFEDVGDEMARKLGFPVYGDKQ
jgi:chromosome segregation ATPase